MPKRVMALLITVGFSFAVAGCEAQKRARDWKPIDAGGKPSS